MTIIYFCLLFNGNGIELGSKKNEDAY